MDTNKCSLVLSRAELPGMEGRREDELNNDGILNAGAGDQ